MEELLKKMVSIIEESTGYWATNNKGFNTDNMMIGIDEDTIIVYDCTNEVEINEPLENIKLVDIRSIENMIISIINFTNRSPLCIHSFVD